MAAVKQRRTIGTRTFAAALFLVVEFGCRQPNGASDSTPKPPTPPSVQSPIAPKPVALWAEPRLAKGLVAEITSAGLGLIFTSERTGTPQLHRYDGEAERALTQGLAHHLQDIALRRREALVTLVEFPSEQLWAVHLDSGESRAVTPRYEKAHAAVLSADERLVAFESSQSGPADIGWVSFDGEREPHLLNGVPATGGFQPSFTPDATRVVYTASESDNPELYITPIDGGRPLRLTAFYREDMGGVVNPQGTHLAFVSNREGADRIFVMRLDGRHTLRLSAAPSDGTAEADPVWMPDGRRVLITVRTDRSSHIRCIDVSNRRVLWVSAGQADQLPRPSPDGRFIAFVTNVAGNADIALMRADGTGATRVTTHPSHEHSPRWFWVRPALYRTAETAPEPAGSARGMGPR